MIDTHCHIDDEQYAPDLDEYIARQKANGVELMLIPSIDSASLKSVPQVCNRYNGYCYPAIGLHPEEVREDWRQVLHEMRQALDEGETKWIAIGEVGLDYHFSTTFKQEQQAVLREQMRWAAEKHLPVMIHSRDSTEDLLNILKEFPTVVGVLHCFSGSREVALQAIKIGYYLGIGGVITFKNSKLAQHLEGIPLDRLLLETDAPYMSPVPFRGKRNESQWMKYVAERLAEVYHCSIEHIDQATTANAKRLFNLP